MNKNTIQQALIWGQQQLKKLLKNSAYLDSEILLAFVLKKTKVYLYTHPEQKVSTKSLAKFKKLVTKRATNYPLAYLTSHKEFFGLDFYVDNRVLIPRPETELLVEQALAICQPPLTAKKSPLTICEVGTGSGGIIISLAKNLPTNFCGQLWASDLSAKALAVAKKNTKRHQVTKKIIFKLGNLLTPFKNQYFDLIIANLPYLSRLNNNIVHEPKLALLAGFDGLKYYRQLIKQTDLYLKPGGYLMIEIDPNQKTALIKLVKKLLPNYQLIFIKDYAKRYRLLKIKKPLH
ncbi:MAG: peptide chain release factor N(5)-glutamine methyltransferase [Candidatus Buchananbacteria bacterium]